MFPVMLEELEKAEKFIFVEYFILEDVRTGRDGYGPQRKAILDKVDAYQDGDNCRRVAEHFHL